MSNSPVINSHYIWGFHLATMRNINLRSLQIQMQTSQSPNVTKMAVCYEMKMAMALAMAMECNADNWACAESGSAAMCSLDYDWITQAHCGAKCSDIVCVWGRRATPLFDKSYGFRATSLAYCVCPPPLCRAKSYRLWWRQTYLSAVESGRRLSWQISTPHLTTLPCLPDIFWEIWIDHCAIVHFALCWLNLCYISWANLVKPKLANKKITLVTNWIEHTGKYDSMGWLIKQS